MKREIRNITFHKLCGILKIHPSESFYIIKQNLFSVSLENTL